MKKKIIVLTMICALVFSLTAWGAAPETKSENEQDIVSFSDSADLMDEVAQLWSAGDDAAAIELLKEAADQDDTWAQYMLADIYLSEESGEHYDEAISYLQILADKGLTEAQDMLGMCYENGLGVDQDYEKAFEYYQMAADDGFPEALYMLGTFYENGWGVDEDEEAAQEYFLLAADGGYDEVLYSIAYAYFYGDGLDIDYEAAVQYLTDAADLGSADAMFLLGLCYEEGYGLDQDLEMAAQLYQEALDAGYEPGEEDEVRLEEVLGEDYDEYFEYLDTAEYEGGSSFEDIIASISESGYDIQGLFDQIADLVEIFMNDGETETAGNIIRAVGNLVNTIINGEDTSSANGALVRDLILDEDSLSQLSNGTVLDIYEACQDELVQRGIVVVE